MIIRQARLEDAGDIREIIINSNVKRNSKKHAGLIEYPTPSMKEIIDRIRNNNLFFILDDNGKIVGFLSAYKDSMLRKLDFTNDAIVRHVLKKQQQFIYWELLVIEKRYQNKGLGKMLIEAFLKEAKKLKCDILGPISHYPHKNYASIKVLSSFGFKLLEEINVYNGLVFGIYEREVSEP